MKLQDLKDIATLFSSKPKLNFIGRIKDNLVCLRMDKDYYYIDFQSGDIFSASELASFKTYTSPFDMALSKFANSSKILDCKLDGLNKILFLDLEVKNAYKVLHSRLVISLIPRSTNLILLVDSKIVAALHYKEDVVLKMPYIPVIQPSFDKTLVDNTNLEAIESSLKERYLAAQEALISQKKASFKAKIKKQLNTLQEVLNALPSDKALEDEMKLSYALANFILSNLDSIPPYATNLVMESKSYKIAAYPSSSELANAEFSKAKKLKRKLKNISLQRGNLESKIELLEEKLSLCENINMLEVLEHTQKANNQDSKKTRCFFYKDVKISVGKSREENVKLLKDAKARYIWMHLKDRPSSHMILHTSKADYTLLKYAGELLCRLNGLETGRFLVDYTYRRDLKVQSNAFVTYNKYSSIYVTL
ncbi:hypothetical protein BKH43_03130 [Helicobacter sp. 13S00401-1]|uniref:DUF814 domain-containing protein n=1 Tax=Helicobacter sp. 13S00401-1 TaxID=1905758 RepID=UPI000BA7A60F|nr:DUF814 domain-containing protein [Helicobacter sp. 13S00401-1]PAF51211.1 hypothetical protein BKH43_03130 [Helicobacter sp. 13S00401-1]